MCCSSTSAGDVGAALTQDAHINGVIFTSSTEVAQLINRNLATREDSPVLIAETGGMNAMIVDSTALAEQVSVPMCSIPLSIPPANAARPCACCVCRKMAQSHDYHD